MQRVIVIVSVVALALFALGLIVALMPTDPCPGCIITPQAILAGLIVGVGVLVAVVAGILTAIDAGQRRDGMALGGIILLMALSEGGHLYFQAAVAVTAIGPGAPGSGAPQPVLLNAANLLLYVALPLATLLYGLLSAQRGPRVTMVTGLATLTLVALVIAAPPWVVFNPANGAPALAVNAPQTSADCAHGQYPPMTIKNTGGGTLTWHFGAAAFDAVTISPTSGTLAAGQSQVAMIVGAYSPPPDRPQEVGVEIDSNGGSQRVIYPCQG